MSLKIEDKILIILYVEFYNINWRNYINFVCFLLFKIRFLHNDFLQETQRLIQEPVEGIQAVPDESNARYFHVIVHGPKEVC